MSPKDKLKLVSNVYNLESVQKARVKGIDVSHYTPNVDWLLAKTNGVHWCYVKFSEGTSMVDRKAVHHVKAAQTAKTLTAGYHFFHANLDGISQAKLYLSAVAPVELDLPHILDWETSFGASPACQLKQAKVWLDAVEEASGRVPWLYGGHSFLASLELPVSFARYPLVIAQYGILQHQLKVPRPWKTQTAWQYTDAGMVTGMPLGHHVDCSWFNGSLQELQAFKL